MFKLLLYALMIISYLASFFILMESASRGAFIGATAAAFPFFHGTLCLIGLAIVCHIDKAAEEKEPTWTGIDPQPTRKEPTISED